jgi:O-antigen/teichoic acid export membrane protein
MSNGIALPEAPVEPETVPAALPRAGASLRENFAWTFAGNVVFAACQGGMLMVLAKLGDPTVVGAFAAALMWTGPAYMFAGLNLRALQATDARHEFAFGHYLGLRLVMVALALAVVTGIAIGGYDGETRTVIVIVAIAKAAEWIADIGYGQMQHNERMRPIAISMILRGVLSLVALGVGFRVAGLWLGAVGLAGVAVLCLVTYDLANVRSLVSDFWPRWDRDALTRLFVTALPLGVVLFLLSLNTTLPRFAVERNHGEAALGIFAALSYVMFASTTLVNALGQSATPRLARLAAAHDRASFVRLLWKLLLLGAGLGVAAVLVAWIGGRLLLTLLYRPEYAEHTTTFVWLMAGAGLGFVASFLGYALTAARVIRAQAPLFAIVCAATALGTWLWVPSHGLIGAAWSLMFAGVVQLIGSIALLIISVKRWETPA